LQRVGYEVLMRGLLLKDSFSLMPLFPSFIFFLIFPTIQGPFEREHSLMVLEALHFPLVVGAVWFPMNCHPAVLVVAQLD